jgi:hypothetical protein
LRRFDGLRNLKEGHYASVLPDRPWACPTCVKLKKRLS